MRGMVSMMVRGKRGREKVENGKKAVMTQRKMAARGCCLGKELQSLFSSSTLSVGKCVSPDHLEVVLWSKYICISLSHCTLVQIRQESGREYWSTHLFICRDMSGVVAVIRPPEE